MLISLQSFRENAQKKEKKKKNEYIKEIQYDRIKSKRVCDNKLSVYTVMLSNIIILRRGA